MEKGQEGGNIAGRWGGCRAADRGDEARGKTGREAHRNSLPPLLFTRVCSASSPTMPVHTNTHIYARSTRVVAHSYAFQDREAQPHTHTHITHVYIYTFLRAPHPSRILVDHAACPCTWIEHTWLGVMHTHTYTYTNARIHLYLFPIGSIASLLLSSLPCLPFRLDHRISRLSASLSSFSLLLLLSPPFRPLNSTASTPSLTYRTLLYV